MNNINFQKVEKQKDVLYLRINRKMALKSKVEKTTYQIKQCIITKLWAKRGNKRDGI